ncbi:MAG: UDP-N-acetylglucosamine 2-epimerase (non-hydrolyzing) [Candidatus Omnitrophica bacterium]|nr:UDP-N-acetylglucosamine 2-epimerase (non-hydrolyzing) [Candidatus Omnitrophota bacterium]MDD5488987.1 UDP-N-acetylglucosamine 2-epimerase (non-hydrolyzing) [Candidatus Omnitrophota bacterium]
MKKLMFVAGARPNFMKIAVLLRLVDAHPGVKAVVVHTGQHYDHEMSQSFLDDLEIREPDHFLDVGSGTHAEQTGKAMTRFEEVCARERPDMVIVVGDVNSTLAASVTAKKMGIKVAHIEAGLRSFDMTMPEEINRILTDSIADLLFVTEKSGSENLMNEGRGGGVVGKKSVSKVFFVGNTMIDSLKFGLDKLTRVDTTGFGISMLKSLLGGYGVVTLHRPSNVDDPEKFKRLAAMLNRISAKVPMIFPIHPRTRKNAKEFGIKFGENIHVVNPLGYLEFMYLYKDAKFVLTDSGGMQEETTYLNIPCFTLRENTERPITMEMGTNVLVGEKIDRLDHMVERILTARAKKGKVPPLWDGKTSERILKIIEKEI